MKYINWPEIWLTFIKDANHPVSVVWAGVCQAHGGNIEREIRWKLLKLKITLCQIVVKPKSKS